MTGHLVRHDYVNNLNKFQHLLIDGKFVENGTKDLGLPMPVSIVSLNFTIAVNDLAWNITVRAYVSGLSGQRKDIEVECRLMKSFNRLTLVDNFRSGNIRSSNLRSSNLRSRASDPWSSNLKLINNCRPTGEFTDVFTDDVDQADVQRLADRALNLCRQVMVNFTGL